MKIENFHLRMQSKYSHETLQTHNFEHELKNEVFKRDAQEQLHLSYEKWFVEKLRLMLLRLLLHSLQQPRHQNLATQRTTLQSVSFESTSHSQRVISRYTEHQSLDVTMQGCVQSENKRIAIDLSLQLSQSVVAYYEVDASHFSDPLVINFEGRLPELESSTFAFDIDCDGTLDEIAHLAEGNAFLALDRNDNGVIDDGSELFGTEIGNGFAELGLFDSDNNLWIDESDPIMQRLRIWSHDDSGCELLTLNDVGIGALYLGHSASSFEYKSGATTLGRLRSSGLFLHEDGTVGTLAQVDLAKQQNSDNASPLRSLLNSNSFKL